MGLALAFCGGIALTTGGIEWCAALWAVLLLLRPRFPFLRPGGALWAIAFATAAGAMHGRAAAGGTGAAPFVGRGVAEAPAAASVRGRIRARVVERIRLSYPEEAPMVEALLLAERSGLDPAVRSSFTKAGGAHLLAISGFHVGVLAGWVFLLLRALGLVRERATVAAAVVVWGYVALLGFPTSAVRAALLLSAAAVGRLRGRPAHTLGGWGLALLLVAVADPGSVVRPGTQLSFAGALGLILWAGRWGDGASRRVSGDESSVAGTGRVRRAGAALARASAASAAAQLATLPIAVWHFQRVAVLGLPATLVATPLVSLALPGALLGLVVESFGVPGGATLTGGVEALLWATRRSMDSMAALDPGLLLGPGSVLAGTAGGVIAWMTTRRGARTLRRAATVTAAAAAAVFWIPLAEAVLDPPELRLHVLDVGQGDAIAVGAPNGSWLLVDTGMGSGERLARKLVREGVRRVDLLVLTHPDLDHMGAAEELLRSMPVAAAGDGGVIRGTGAYRQLIRSAARERVPWRVLTRGERWVQGGLVVEVLHPPHLGEGGLGGETPTSPSPNDRSVVLRLSWGEFDALLTGDVSAEVEVTLLPFLQEVEFLKVGHHGSRTSSSTPFLDVVSPEVAVISVGRRNRFGHPAPEVLRRLQEAGSRVFRTDRDGDVLVRVRRDGSWTVETERSLRAVRFPPGD